MCACYSTGKAPPLSPSKKGNAPHPLVPRRQGGKQSKQMPMRGFLVKRAHTTPQSTAVTPQAADTASASHVAAPKDSTSKNVAAAAAAAAGAAQGPTRDAVVQDGDRWLEEDMNWEELDCIEQSYAARNVPQQQQEQQQQHQRRQHGIPAHAHYEERLHRNAQQAEKVNAQLKQASHHLLPPTAATSGAAGPGALQSSGSEVAAAHAASMAAAARGMPVLVTPGPARTGALSSLQQMQNARCSQEGNALAAGAGDTAVAVATGDVTATSGSVSAANGAEPAASRHGASGGGAPCLVPGAVRKGDSFGQGQGLQAPTRSRDLAPVVSEVPA